MAAPSPENLEMRPSPVSSTRTRSKMGLEPSQHKRQAVHELRTSHSSTSNNTNNPETICPRSCRTSSPECPKRLQVNAGLQAKSKGVVSQGPWLTTRQLLKPLAPNLIPIHKLHPRSMVQHKSQRIRATDSNNPAIVPKLAMCISRGGKRTASFPQK